MLLECLQAALARVAGDHAVASRLRQAPVTAPVGLVAVGKAAQAMTLGAVEVLGREGIHGGLVISKPGHLDPGRLAALGLEALEGGHPLPTRGSLEAGRRLLHWLQRSDCARLLVLISGGASSLLEVPVPGLDLDDLRRVGRWLLASGLPIDDMNRVRKSLSLLKAGGLLRWTRGYELRVLAISDVRGDDPAVIGSGPLTPDPGLEAAVHALDLPAWLRDWVARGLEARRGLPATGPPVEIVASLDQAKAAAAGHARALGVPVQMHREFLEGDAAAAGRRLARVLCATPPGLQVWGGETTVRLPPEPGRGGRNQHLALAAAEALAGQPACTLLAAGTDGTDGPTGDAGALVDGGTWQAIRDLGLDPASALARADAGSVLEAVGALVDTGPTGTNVMDLVLGWRSAP